MEKYDVLEYLASSPDVLLDIVGEILKRYRNAIDKQSSVESQKQLVEISKTIDRLESASIPVPDELRNLKSSLLSLSNDRKQAMAIYDMLIRGLSNLCTIYKQNGHAKSKRQKRDKGDGSQVRQGCRTSRNTFIRAIVQVMEQMGNSGSNKEIHQKVEVVLADVLTPEDYELDSIGRVIWYHQVDWARLYMAKIGMIKNDSPRGVWELSDRYKELLGGLK